MLLTTTISLLFAALAAPASAAPTKRDAITSCLTSAKVPIDVKASADWTQDSTAYNLRLQYQPVAIVVPKTTAHIAAAVKCAAKNGVQISAKSGGHSYASFGLGGSNGHLVIELDRLYSVKLDKKDNTARIQPGARLGHVATELYNQGKRAISHGTCPGVGIGGHALHGGYGMVSHKYGLALDWIKGATVVLANGAIVHCSAKERPALFFAIRGAGSSFAIVAELEFNTFAAPETLTTFDVSLGFNQQSAPKGLKALQDFAKTMPAELSMQAVVSKNGYTLDGTYIGDEAGIRKTMQPLLSKLGVGMSTQTMGWMQFIAHFAGNVELNPTSASYNAHDTFYASSLFVPEVSESQFKAFADYVATTGASSSHSWWIQMDMIGGKNSGVSKHKTTETAFAHRDKMLLFQLYDSVPQGQQYPADGFGLLKGFRDSITKSMASGKWGMYPNYIDSQLNGNDAPKLYWGANLPKLQDIKAGYDPKNLIRNPQSVKPIKLSK